MPQSVLAVDVGGTKFAVALVDPTGNVQEARRVATPPGGDAAALWETLVDLIGSVLRTAGRDDLGSGMVAGVGVGCGGPMTWPEGEVSPLNMPGWRGFPLRARLASRFPGVPVRVHNDAVCLAVAEHWRGAGRGSADMLGMVVSTGVGGGLILGGRLIDGGSGNAGHIGHVVVDPDGPECRCGGRGCLEAVARGPGLAAWAVEQGWVPGAVERSGQPYAGPDVPPYGEAVAEPDTGHGTGPGQAEEPGTGPDYVEETAASGRRLALDAAAGDEIALAALDRAGRALGVAIASAVNLCDLDVVTVGGGLSQAGPLLFEPLRAALREHARMGFARRVKVVPAALGQDAGLVGAAALVLAADRYWSR
ncbi:ROK family protein [Streptosporangium sandarakinum]